MRLQLQILVHTQHKNKQINKQQQQQQIHSVFSSLLIIVVDSPKELRVFRSNQAQCRFLFFLKVSIDSGQNSLQVRRSWMIYINDVYHYMLIEKSCMDSFRTKIPIVGLLLSQVFFHLSKIIIIFTLRFLAIGVFG